MDNEMVHPVKVPTSLELLAMIDALRAEIAASRAAGVDVLLGSVDRLLAATEEQGRQIGELATHVGLLTQSVAQLLGEETGHPVDDEQEPQRVDLDGEPY